MRRRTAMGAALAAGGLVVLGRDIAFSLVTNGRTAGLRSNSHAPRKSKLARSAASFEALGASTTGFNGSDASLWTSLFVFTISLPGVYSTVQRSGQAKFVEKTYVMPGTEAGGLEMRSIAAGIMAYFKGLNYSMQDAPRQGKIRFIGNLQGSLSQALYLTGCLAGAFLSLGFVVQSILPEGPFGMGPSYWFSPMIFSPAAGVYYWTRAFRRDIVELQLEMNDECTTTTLLAVGDKETVETMQKGVRFMSNEGKMYQLMEKDMEYQPGIFEDMQTVTVWKEKEPAGTTA